MRDLKKNAADPDCLLFMYTKVERVWLANQAGKLAYLLAAHPHDTVITS